MSSGQERYIFSECIGWHHVVVFACELVSGRGSPLFCPALLGTRFLCIFEGWEADW